MGWVVVVLGSLAAYGFYSEEELTLALLTGATTAINFWSYGVMHNLAVDAATHRPDYRGGFSDLTERDLRSVPNWLTKINLASAIAVAGFLVWSAVELWT